MPTPNLVGGRLFAYCPNDIIIHDHHGQPGAPEIKANHERDAMSFCRRVAAYSFDPATAPMPDLTVPLEGRATDGMGLHSIQQVMGSAIHPITPQAGNGLLLLKRLEGDSEDFDI